MDDQQTIKIRSAIKPELIRLTLKKGGWIAAAGAFLLISGTMISLAQLKVWGIPIFFTSLILIAIGLLPYRQLLRLQIKPHELIYDGNYLHFLKQGRPLLKIPLISIQEMKYIEKEHLYGLAIWLKNPPEEKIVVHKQHFKLNALIADSRSRFGCDLFLPYFTKAALSDLE